MGIYEDTTNNIKYNSVSTGVGFSKISHKNTDLELEDIVPVVNAVEIDWNGANLGSYIINSTGELLSYMSTISQKISNLENILVNL